MSASLFHPPARLSTAELLAATGAELVAGAPPRRAAPGYRLCTDSRRMDDESIFVALRGETHDGHDYVADVLARFPGAGALVERLPAGLAEREGPVLLVRDTLVALGDAARAHLQRFAPAVAAVTGSVGKTTTRSMLGSILRRLGPGLESEGNFNNRIGVPLTLLHLGPEHRWVVLEMGMSEPGEIRELARIAGPRVRVITEVAAAHLEFFDSVEQIADAKGELFEAARPGDTLVFPADHRLRARFPRPPGARFCGVSLDPESEGLVKALRIDDRGLAGSEVHVDLAGLEFDLRVPLPGRHQVHNALLAAAAAWALGVGPPDIVQGLAAVEVPGRRMKVRTVRGATVLDDAYNANPSSMAAALRTLAHLDGDGRRIAAVGDMLELGPTGPELHAEVGRYAARLGVALFIGAGPLMASAVAAAREAGIEALEAADSEEAGRLLDARLRPGDLLLLKGSRGMRMERVLDVLDPPLEPALEGR